MTKILFVCLGNICRSPMAESVMTHLIRQRGLTGIEVASAATSTWEIGNPVHQGTQTKLAQMNIPLVPHRARVMTANDGREFDLLIGLDAANLKDMSAIVGGAEKVHQLLEWSPNPRDIADPWFTGNFDVTFDDIWEGCNTLLDTLAKN